MKSNTKWRFVLIAAFCLAALTMCGGEGPAEGEGLSAAEQAALKTQYSLEALESIDETNAEAEAEKLAAEIEADR